MCDLNDNIPFNLYKYDFLFLKHKWSPKVIEYYFVY